VSKNDHVTIKVSMLTQMWLARESYWITAALDPWHTLQPYFSELKQKWFIKISDETFYEICRPNFDLRGHLTLEEDKIKIVWIPGKNHTKERIQKPSSFNLYLELKLRLEHYISDKFVPFEQIISITLRPQNVLAYLIQL